MFTINSLLKNGLVAAHGCAVDFIGFKKSNKTKRLTEKSLSARLMHCGINLTVTVYRTAPDNNMTESSMDDNEMLDLSGAGRCQAVEEKDVRGSFRRVSRKVTGRLAVFFPGGRNRWCLFFHKFNATALP